MGCLQHEIDDFGVDEGTVVKETCQTFFTVEES